MKFLTSIIGVGLLLCGLQLSAQQADAGASNVAKAATFTIITFDAPNASTGPSMGTFPADINPQGEITGYYYMNSETHGFLREPDGTFITFDVPQAANGGTVPISINPRVRSLDPTLTWPQTP